MNTYTAIGLLMILGTICVIVVIAAFFGFRSAAQKDILTAMAAMQQLAAEKNTQA